MINNVQSLKDKAKNFANKNNLQVQVVLQNFMFERFLERLSKSKYKDNFILKGGFLLSSIMGINIRSTMDIDANITGMDFNETEIRKLLNEIAVIDLNDNVTFKVGKEKTIREDNEYGGYCYKIIGQFYNVVIPFFIDISTGDIITPKSIKYKYKTLLENDYIELYTYNYETIIAEKFQTILVRSVANSRMKDFFDLYYFVTYKWNEINKETLQKAITMTFKHRESEKDLQNFEKIINLIENDETMHVRWKSYQNRFLYAKDIDFKDVIKAINKLKNTYNNVKFNAI